MEANMSHQDRPGRRDSTDRELQTKRDLQPDSMLRTSRGSAMWSLVTAIAIVFVLFVAFYGITAQRQNTAQSTVNSRAVTAVPTPAAGVSVPAPETTTGQAPAPAAPSTAGQGGRPENEDAR
jgi:hypothetical protein